MWGTLLNVAAILVGGAAGLILVRDLAPERQRLLKQLLGVFTVYVGLSMTWASLHGRWWQILGQIATAMLAMMLGKLIGGAIGIQTRLNRLGQAAKQALQQAQQSPTTPSLQGFVTCSILFCVGPIAILGSLQEGLFGSVRTLGIKAVMDGLASMAFARTFGGSVLLSALPVLAYQGTLTLLARYLAPILYDQSLLDAMGVTGGLLVFCISLIILELKKIALGDYLPSLVVAPLLTWLWRWF